MTASLVVLQRIAIVMLIATFAVALAGIGRLELDSHYSAYFDRDDPRLVAHEEISDLYSRHDAVFVVLQSADSFLEHDNYVLLEELTTELAALPSATRAVSITELGIVGEPLTEGGYPVPGFEQLAENNRAIGLLLSENTRLAGIQVQIDLPDNASATVLRTLKEVRQTVATTIGNRPVSAHYTGTLALNEAYINVVRHDLLQIMPLLLLVMIGVLGWLLRGFRAVLTMLPVGICSVGFAFGMAGLFGVKLAAINAFVPIIILSISMAGCVHMALSYIHYRDNGRPANDAARKAVHRNLLPMSLANGTTALGFLALALSPSPPVRVVGYLVATGIAASFVFCITLLPVLQARFDPWRPADETRSRFLDLLRTFIAARRKLLVAVFALLAFPAVWLASQNVISDNIFEYFVPSHAFYRDTQLVEKQLSGVNEVLYSVESTEELGIFNADTIESIDEFAAWLRQLPEVNRVLSVADAAVLQEAMLEGRLQTRLDFYKDRMGTSSDADSLLALGVSGDFSSSLVVAYLEPLDSSRLLNFDKAVHAWATENMGDFGLRSGGPALMFANLGEQNIKAMLFALSAALLGAALVLGAALRSVRVAWIGLACNMLPVLLVYSVWAVADGQISIGAAVVMGMILGIVVDDTIYLLVAYNRGLQRRVNDPNGYALRRVGPALIVTTVTLVSGLSLGLLSDFGPIWDMSVLSVAIISTALIVDLLLLPSLLPPTANGGIA